MANVLSRLVVLLGLDAAEYTKGLTKAEYQTKKFAANTKTAIDEIGKVLGSLAIGKTIYETTKQIIEEAAALQDLSEATGSSVESLSRLNNQTKIAGGNIDDLNNALITLTQGMAGTDRQSVRVQKTLQLLGVTAKDPAQAFEQLALKLATYADGPNKLALATAIWGGQAKKTLAILQEMSSLQDVQATRTAEQVAAAEQLGKEYARLSYESQKFAEVVLNSLVPSLITLIKTFTDTTSAADSFGRGLTGTINLLLRSGSDAARLRDVNKEIEALQDSLKESTPFKGLDTVRQFFDSSVLEQLKAEKATLEKRLREQARSQIEKDVSGVFGPKPNAPPPPPPGRGGAGDKERTTDAERLIQALQRQVVAQQELNEVDKVELEIARLQKDATSGLTAEREAQLRLLAKEIDAGKEADRVAKELAKSQEAAAKEKEKFAEATRKSIEAAQREADGIRRGNESIREQIIELRGGKEALDAYTAAKREALALAKEREATDKEAQGWTEEAQAIRDVAAALREANAAVGDLRIAEKMAEEARKLQEVKNLFSDALVDPLTDFVTGAKSAKDAFRDLVNDITRQLARLASQNVANALFGGNTSGGADVFGMLAKMLGGMGGGGLGYGTAGSAIPPGPYPYSTGGVHRGGLALVGEMGPELVDLPAGARIRPNNQVRTSDVGPRISIVQNIDRNADTRAHRQAALQAFSVAAGAARRR